MSGDGLRVPIDVALPADMDPRLRAVLADVFRRISTQVNRLSQRSVIVEADHTAAEDVVLADASAGAVTITLMPASVWTDKVVHVKKIDPGANLVKVISAGGAIDGTTTHTLAASMASFSFVSNGADWYIV